MNNSLLYIPFPDYVVAIVMTAPVISISSDTSEESVGSHAPRVILFGAIPAIIPVIPEVPIVPADPIVTPEADDESEPAEQRPVSSSHDTLAPLSEFPLAPVVAPPGICQCSAILVRPGFVHRSLARTPRHSKAFRRWRSAPLSTPYPPTTSESSLGSYSERSLDLSSPSSSPSRKRCRSLTTLVPSPTHVSRSIAPTPADFLPPRKSISEGVVAHPEDDVGMGFEIATSDVKEDDEESEAEASVANTREIVVDPLVISDSSESSRGDWRTTQRQLETSQIVASGERVSLVKRIGSLRWEYLKEEFIVRYRRERDDTTEETYEVESYV
ncbi:hypothetical protein Tco_0742998 [Tanacetum coccineum]